MSGTDVNKSTYRSTTFFANLLDWPSKSFPRKTFYLDLKSLLACGVTGYHHVAGTRGCEGPVCICRFLCADECHHGNLCGNCLAASGRSENPNAEALAFGKVGLSVEVMNQMRVWCNEVEMS